jgi:membrane protease YdiL (CAAX protease family)
VTRQYDPAVVSAGQRRLNRRLVWWTVVVGFMATVAYAAQLSGSDPPEDVAYRWESSIFGAAWYAILLGIVLLLTLGFDRREFLALRRPRSWWRAAGISTLVILIVFVVARIVDEFGNAEEEQGLIPDRFDSSRAAQFAAFAAVVVIVAPVVEELMFRGAGYTLLEPLGPVRAAVLVGLAFAFVHGLLIGFPVIATFGIGLAFLRGRTESIYPCILLHASFNAFGLAIGIATGG